MNSTIVILLILLILQSLIRMARGSQISTKKSAIAFYKRKMNEEIESETSNNIKATAYLFVLITDIAVIYYAIQSILSLIK